MRIKTIKDTLPETLHELLKVALDDLEVVRGKKKYKISMRNWHEGGWDSFKCAVCLAGSVMARLIDYDYETDLDPEDFQESIDKKFCAIDELRTFELKKAFIWLYVDRFRRASLTNKAIDKFTHELENLRESLRVKGGAGAFESIPKFTNFNKSMEVYRGLQKELKALGV